MVQTWSYLHGSDIPSDHPQPTALKSNQADTNVLSSSQDHRSRKVFARSIRSLESALFTASVSNFVTTTGTNGPVLLSSRLQRLPSATLASSAHWKHDCWCALLEADSSHHQPHLGRQHSRHAGTRAMSALPAEKQEQAKKKLSPSTSALFWPSSRTKAS